GFINMLAHPEESLIADGRALSDLRQGVTLEVLGEDSMGPLTPEMKRHARERQADIHYTVDWTTLGEYLHKLERHGIAPNVASFVGAGTVRTNVLGERDVQPTAAQLERMRTLVRQAMEEGALRVTTALIYSPNQYARTPELMALASESARCGGIYSVHMRSEGDRLLEAAQETIDIARASGAPAEIYHLKAAGRGNWGKPLAEVAKMRGVSAEDAAIDLVIQDGSRVAVGYFLMSEENVRRELALPWVSFDSDADAPAPEGVFLKSSRHPRTYGNFARLLAKYVREERLLGLEQAIHKLTALPAATLSLADRGLLKTGDFADVVVFNPATTQDHATYEHLHQLAPGVDEVWVNGVRALRD